MKLYVYMVSLLAETDIYVLAINKSNAMYKAYNKAIKHSGLTPSNDSFEKWKRNVDSINELFAIGLDDSKFNLF